MSEHHTQNTQNQTLAVIPPGLLLGLSAIGFFVALGVALTQNAFNIVGWAGLAIGILSLVAWAFLAPEQLTKLLRGRALSYGGTGFVVTGVFIAALVLIYILIDRQGWRVDLSTGEFFSLTQEAEVLVTQLTLDPATPDIRIIAFYGPAQGGQRDRLAVLLDDVVRASNGSISYEFIDPDRQPLLTESYGAVAGQLYIAPLTDEGEPSIEQAEQVGGTGQQAIIDALIRVTATGDFRAYFLTVQDGVPLDDNSPSGANILATSLRDTFNWTVENTSLLDLSDPDSDVLGAAADGEVLVIPGGSAPLPDEALTVLTDYLDGGGNVVIFGGISFDGDELTALATADNLSGYLQDSFGVQMQNNTVIDLNSTFALGSPLDLVVQEFAPDQRITRNYGEGQSLVLRVPHSLSIADEAPENVAVTPLAFSTEAAYAKDDLNFSREITGEQIQQANDDTTGPFVLGAAAENTETGAKLVLWGSESLLYNQFQQFDQLGLRNIDAARNSLFWAADYENFFENIPQLSINEQPQNQPVLASPEQLRSITFVAMGVLPFSVLGVGVFVWWRRRQADMA